LIKPRSLEPSSLSTRKSLQLDRRVVVTARWTAALLANRREGAHLGKIQTSSLIGFSDHPIRMMPDYRTSIKALLP
jgi:hypothetical protein